MSYNISSVNAYVLNASIEAAKVIDLLEQYEDELPECCFLDEMRKAAEEALRARVTCARCEGETPVGAEFCMRCGTKLDAPKDPPTVRLPNFWFYGEGSGGAYSEDVLESVAKHVRGEVQAIFIWEGGDSVTGVAIKDGKYAKCKVEQRLVLPEGW